VKRTAWLVTVFVLSLCTSRLAAFGWLDGLERVNRQLAGHIVDHTHNHGADHRIWSAALGECRDLYVYLPPGFDPHQAYPVVFWLHGIAQDEQSFLNDGVAETFDRAIVAGKLPPMIVVAPDGSRLGRPSLLYAGNAFLNTRAGRFQDYLIDDVWNFVFSHYPIRPEREAHAISGVSIGGGNAFNLAIKFRDRFGVVFGIFPPLNLRWMDCHGRYAGNFDPDCWGWRTDINRGHEVLARFYVIFPVRLRTVAYPLYGRGPDAIERISRENPIEMLDTYDVRPGELQMYAAYGGRDEFNIDAQVESFLYRARERGLCVGVGYEPRGRHDVATAKRLAPGIIDWLGPRLAPYAPPLVCNTVVIPEMP
jgi:S-formylglutathione hydrolase FrmB